MEAVQTAWAAVLQFFDGFFTGNTPITLSQLFSRPENMQWFWTMCAVCGGYLFLFILLPLFQWARYLKGKPALFRFWFAFLTQVFFVVNAVFLLSLLRIANTVTLIFAILLYTVLVRCHGRWRVVGTALSVRFDIYRRMFGGKYGFRLLLRNDGRAVGSWLKKKSIALLRHISRHPLEYLLLLAVFAVNLWFYSYGAMHWNSYGFGDEYTHTQWVYQMTQGSVFAKGIYPFAMHCKIYALHTVIGTPLHETVLYFGLSETMLMLAGVYTFLRTVSKRHTVAVIGLILSSFAPYVPTLVIRRYQWSLPEECAIYLIFPTVFFLIRWLRDDVLPAPAQRTGPITFIRSFWTRAVFTDNLLLFGMSVSLVVATHFYTAIIAAVFCAAVCLVFLSKILEENRIFPLMLTVVGAGIVTVLPYAISLLQGNYFEASIEWALNVAGTSAGGQKNVVGLMLVLGGAAVACVLLVTLLCWGLAQIRSKKAKSKYFDFMLYTVDGIMLAVGGICIWRYAQQLQILRFSAILRGNVVGKGLFGLQWGTYILGIAAALLILSLYALICGRAARAQASLSVLLTYFIIITMYCLPQLGFPQLMDQVRVSVFASVLTPVVIAMVLDYLLDFPVPWFLAAPCSLIYGRWKLKKANAALTLAEQTDKAETEKKRKVCFKRIRKIVGECAMAAACIGLAAVLVFAGQLHPLTEMEFTQYNAATDCLRSIIRDYDDFTWTLVSPTDELYQSAEHGFHEETVSMISDLDRKTYYTLPSEYVFFFIEKDVLHYAQALEYQKGTIVTDPVSYEEAMKPFVLSSSFSSNYNKNRLCVMSKMYYWAQAFAKRYPNELKVYYEDAQFVCYMLRQNTYSLYNLDVDYGYRLSETAK